MTGYEAFRAYMTVKETGGAETAAEAWAALPEKLRQCWEAAERAAAAAERGRIQQRIDDHYGPTLAAQLKAGLLDGAP